MSKHLFLLLLFILSPRVHSKRMWGVRDRKNRKWFLEPEKKGDGYIFYELKNFEQWGECSSEYPKGSRGVPARPQEVPKMSQEYPKWSRGGSHKTPKIVSDVPLRDPQVFIKLKLLSDEKRLLQFDSKEKERESTLNIFTQVQELYESFQEGGVKFQFVLEGQEESLFSGPIYSRDRLREFGKNYTGDSLFIHLLTGTPFEGGVIGIATLGSACWGGRGITYSHQKDAITAKTLAHEIGHNLGIHHTTEYINGKTCPILQAVMSPILFGSEGVWEDCSREWFKISTHECLMGEGENVCGNLKVDPGEECDHWGPCCKDCKMVGECVDGECCEGCKLTKKIITKGEGDCRESVQCGKGEFTKNHFGCRKGLLRGICYNGECVGRDIQCNSINPAYGYWISGSCGDWGDCNELKCWIGSVQRCDTPFSPGKPLIKDGSICQTSKGLGVCMNKKCVIKMLK